MEKLSTENTGLKEEVFNQQEKISQLERRIESIKSEKIKDEKDGLRRDTEAAETRAQLNSKVGELQAQLTEAQSQFGLVQRSNAVSHEQVKSLIMKLQESQFKLRETEKEIAMVDSKVG